jgi:hypothetical protein
LLATFRWSGKFVTATWPPSRQKVDYLDCLDLRQNIFKFAQIDNCCAGTARNIHERIGYDKRKTIVIPDGFDLSEFVSESGARERKWVGLGPHPTQG